MQIIALTFICFCSVLQWRKSKLQSPSRLPPPREQGPHSFLYPGLTEGLLCEGSHLTKAHASVGFQKAPDSLTSPFPVMTARPSWEKRRTLAFTAPELRCLVLPGASPFSSCTAPIRCSLCCSDGETKSQGKNRRRSCCYSGCSSPCCHHRAATPGPAPRAAAAGNPTSCPSSSAGSLCPGFSSCLLSCPVSVPRPAAARARGNCRPPE